MRIYNNKCYIKEIIPGISGFQRWHEREYKVMSGRFARHCKSNIIREFIYNGGKFRVEDGHLPDCCPVVNSQQELQNALQQDNDATMLNPELYELKTQV